MYKKLPHGSLAVVRDDGAIIQPFPPDPDYVAWLAAGNTPAPADEPPRADLDSAIRSACANTIAAGFAVGGVSMRASMNLWMSTVLAVQIASGTAPTGDDATCLAMAPKLNAWESSMFVERDRLIAAGLTVADAKWPILPDGAAAFVTSCNQG